MGEVPFDTVSEELSEARELTLMQVLVRSSLYNAYDNRPAIAILTDNAMFYGGQAGREHRFERVPYKSVVHAEKRGTLLWECLELTHMDLEGERKVYVCPFKGKPHKPVKDEDAMNKLQARLRQNVCKNV